MNKPLRTFIDNLFMTINQTKEIKALKEDLYNSSLDKYNDLVSSGLTENAALGKVISEFGSIEEILNVFNIDKGSEVVSGQGDYELVDEYFTKYKKYGRLLGLAIALMTVFATVIVSFYFIVRDWLNLPVMSIVAVVLLIPAIVLIVLTIKNIVNDRKVVNSLKGNLINRVKFKEIEKQNKTKMESLTIISMILVLVSFAGISFLIANSKNVYESIKILYPLTGLLLAGGLYLITYIIINKWFYNIKTKRSK